MNEKEWSRGRVLAGLERVVGALAKIENAVADPVFCDEVRQTRVFWERRCQKMRGLHRCDEPAESILDSPLDEFNRQVEGIWNSNVAGRSRDELLAVQFGRAEALLCALLGSAALGDTEEAEQSCRRAIEDAAAE